MTESTPQMILLVDDDKFLEQMYARKFEAEGFRVLKVGSAQEALDILKGGEEPAAIIFDVIMPRMDGFGFLEELKKNTIAPRAAKIVLSNQGEAGEIQRLKESGADAFIAKAAAIPSEVVKEVIEVIANKPR